MTKLFNDNQMCMMMHMPMCMCVLLCNPDR